MKRQHYSLKDVARMLKLKPYQITYAFTVGLVAEPALRISNNRIFVEEDIERLREHFAATGGHDGKW